MNLLKSILLSLVVWILFVVPVSAASTLAQKMSGRILLQTESRGEAWYVYPVDLKRYYLGRPADAFALMRKLGLGVHTADVEKFRRGAPQRLLGRIVIDVDDHGKAYYLYPLDGSVHYLGRPQDAFALMRKLGLGITNKNLSTISIGLGPTPIGTTNASNRVDVETPSPDHIPPLDSTPPVVQSLKITSAQPSVETETVSGQLMKHVHIDVIVADPALKAVGTEWKMDIALDAKTVDAQGATGSLFNGAPISHIDFQTPYKLKTATFVLDSRVPASQTGRFTTTLTARDLISGSSQDTAVVNIDL